MITIRDNTGHVVALLTIEEYLAAEAAEVAALMARAAADPVK